MTAADAIHGDAVAEGRFRLPERVVFWLLLAWLFFYWVVYLQSVLPNNSPPGTPVTRWDVATLLPDLYLELISPTPPEGIPRSRLGAVSGLRFLSQRLPILGWGLFIVVSSAAAGRLLLRSTIGRLNRLPFAERWALTLGLGHSLLSLLTLGLGVIGLLWRGPFLSAFLAGIGLEAFLTWGRRTEAYDSARIRLPADGRRFGRWCLVACVPFLIAMLLGAMLPSTDFDVKEYHFQGPKEYILAGRIHFLRHNVYTSFPFLTEMLSLAGMVVHGDWYWGALVGKGVLMSFAPITALAVYAIARRVVDERAGWLAALAYLSTPWSYRISIIAYTEGALCCYVSLTLLAFLIFRERFGTAGERAADSRIEGGPANWSLILGLSAGSAVSTKYPGLVLVTIPFFLALAFAVRRRPRREIAAILSMFSLGVLIAFGPWMLKNLLETGNPVYPLLYSVFGGIDWNPELNEQWRQAHSRPAGVFASPGAFMRDLWGQIDAVAIKNDWQSPLLFGMAPLALLAPQRKRILGIAAFAGVILLAWDLLTHRLDRFWVPVIPVLAVLSGIGMAAVLRPAEDLVPWRLRPVVAVLLCGSLIFNLGFVVSPLSGNNSYLMNYDFAEQATKTPAVAITESLRLPDEAKVLFVGEAQLFDARFDYAYNTVFDENLLESWTSDPSPKGGRRLKDKAEIRRRFEEEGITHVFVNWSEILRYRTTYGYTPYVTPELLNALETMELLTPIPLAEGVRCRKWDGLAPTWQREVDAHLATLRIQRGGEDLFVGFQVFAYNPGP